MLKTLEVRESSLENSSFLPLFPATLNSATPPQPAHTNQHALSQSSA